MTNITIKDIAQEANVSKTTVSRVLNDACNVDPETRKRIQGIIEKRNYSPSAVAKSLSRQESITIGVIVPDISNPFFGEALKGIIEVINNNNLAMILCNTDDDAEKDRKSLEMLKEHRVRGVIYTPAFDYSSKEDSAFFKKSLKKIVAPVVLLDRRIDFLRLDGVYFDDYQTAYDAVKKFIEAGHRKIAIINASDEKSLPRLRHQGYMQALLDAGIAPDERYHFLGDYLFKKTYEQAKIMLAMEDRPTAVLATNNTTSMGFLKALYERNEKIPDDISCIGFDKINIMDIIDIQFNYVERDAYIAGKTAMELLIKKIAFPNKSAESIFVNAPFIIKSI